MDRKEDLKRHSMVKGLTKKINNYITLAKVLEDSIFRQDTARSLKGGFHMGYTSWKGVNPD